MLEIIRKFFQFAGKHRPLLQRGIIFAFLDSVFHAVQIMALYVVLRDIIADNVSMTTAVTAFVIMLISLVGVIVTKYSTIISDAQGSFYMCADKRTEIGDRMKNMPMGYFNSNSLGTITATVTNTMEDIQDVAPRVLNKVIHGLIHAIIVTLMLVIFDWRIGFIALGGILLFMGVNVLMQRISKRISPARVAAQTSLVGAILEYVQGMSVVRSFNLAHDANKTIDRAIAECERQNIGLEIAFIPFLALQSLVLKFVSVSLILAAIFLYLFGTMELNVCLLMMISAFIIFSQIENAGSVSALLRMIDNSIDRVQEIYKMPTMNEANQNIKPREFAIRGDNITFSYDKKTVINDVSFEISQGETVAIIGPSGGGKTTLCNLIARFWDPDSGIITLGGKDLREYSLDSLLVNFSMVFQRVYLFNDTIANNIKFGKPDASLEEVRKAAQKACCDDFIMQLPDGYDTIIGEGGATISGGEKQRISIARAILKDAPIIILDEATANVDPENESQLQTAITELTKNKTIIMIAHRLKTVRHADQIWVLDQGRIIQRGSHEELMNAGGLYADFIGMRERTIGWKLGNIEAAAPSAPTA